MGVTVTGKLNKPAHQFPAGPSTGFGVRIGQQVYNPKTKTKEWTNYKAVFFSKNSAQIQYLNTVLIDGAIIEINGDSQLIEVYEGQNGQQISIEICNAKLGFAHTGEQPVQQAAPQLGTQAGVQQVGNYQPQVPQTQASYQPQVNATPPPASDDFDDDIPF